MVSPQVNDVGTDTLEEILPNHRTEMGGHDISSTDALVVGRVVGAEMGSGYLPPEGESPSGTKVDAERDDAQWRSVHLEVEVDEVLGHSVIAIAPGETIRVGLTLGGGPIRSDQVLESLESLGTAVFFVKQMPFDFDDVDGVLHLSQAGSTTLLVETGGSLSLPLYTDLAEPLVAARVDDVPDTGPVATDLTLSSLAAMASEPVSQEVLRP